MGGRGESSATSGGRELGAHAGHDEIPGNASELAKTLGVSYREAQQIRKSIRTYSGDDYGGIIAAQLGDPTMEKYYGQDATNLETFIDAAPKWNAATTYRGDIFSNEQLSDLKVGETLSIEHTASWTSDEYTANEFAYVNRANGGNPVVLVSETQSKGASIKNISTRPSESEVLVSKNASYTITGMETKPTRYYNTGKDYTYVYVRENY